MQTGLTMAPLSLTMFVMAILAGKRAGDRRPAAIIRTGFVLAAVGMVLVIPLVPRIDSGWYLVVPLVLAGGGLGLLVSQLNNYTLAPVEEERISEAAGVNSAAGSFGLSLGLAVAGGVMLAVLSFSFTNQTRQSAVIPPAEKEQITSALEQDAEVMSTTQLDERITGQPPEVEEEILDINTLARNRSLQIALLVPVIAALAGFANSLRMIRLPDLKPSAPLDGMDFG